MSLALSSRMDCVDQSDIRRMTLECTRLGGINLAQGVCDTEVPAMVRQAAQEAIDSGFNTYTRYDGLDELRKAIALKQERFTGLAFDPHGEIIVSAGATGAFYSACLALLNPGDECILFEPFYGYHVSTLKAVQAVPVLVRTSPPNWSFSYEDLARVRTARTKAIMVNTPSNPSGKVFRRSELEVLARFAEENDLLVFSDEIYEHFIFDGLSHLSPAAIPGLRERSILISGVSKTFSVTGWRIGYCLCNSKWAEAIGYFNDLVYVCAPAPLQLGVARGLLDLTEDYYSGLSRDFTAKREKICSALQAAGLTPQVPSGAYYVLADLSILPGSTSRERAMELLGRTGVACVPGTAFYGDDAGEAFGRFSFAKRDDVLDEACERIRGLNR
ncbi:MAG: pyridoxal phosphate-dependent aminotransferase [Syntrophobacteraceae bacterium]